MLLNFRKFISQEWHGLQITIKFLIKIWFLEQSLSKIRMMNDVFDKPRNLIALNYLTCIIKNPDSVGVKNQFLSKKILLLTSKPVKVNGATGVSGPSVQSPVGKEKSRETGSARKDSIVMGKRRKKPLAKPLVV